MVIEESLTQQIREKIFISPKLCCTVHRKYIHKEQINQIWDKDRQGSPAAFLQDISDQCLTVISFSECWERKCRTQTFMQIQSCKDGDDRHQIIGNHRTMCHMIIKAINSFQPLEIICRQTEQSGNFLMILTRQVIGFVHTLEILLSVFEISG